MVSSIKSTYIMVSFILPSMRAKDFGIARSTLHLWIQQNTPNHTGKVPREEYLKDLELERLRIENQIFRICGYSPSSPLKERLKTIAEHKDEFNIYRLCKALDVRKSTFYYYSRRMTEKTLTQMEDDELGEHIPRSFKKSKGRFGTRKIRVKLLEEGYNLS